MQQLLAVTATMSYQLCGQEIKNLLARSKHCGIQVITRRRKAGDKILFNATSDGSALQAEDEGLVYPAVK